MIPGLPPFNNADLILPRLWLGNAKAALDEDFLRQKGIQVVFNCTKDLPFHPSMKRRYRVPVDDNLEREEIRNMEHWSFEILYKLLNEYKDGRTILVHCAAGMSRSPTLVIAYLMIENRWSFEEAYNFVKKKRPLTEPNIGFVKQLKNLEYKLKMYNKLL